MTDAELQRGDWTHTLYHARLPHLGALGVYLFLLGGTWDVSWHIVIGRDTFWSPPHLVLYAGINLILLTLAGAVVHARRLARRGIAYPGPTLRLPGGPAVNPGIVVAGLGAVMALTSAPIDNYWHAAFGLDVVIWSPPHIQLVFGVAFAALGMMVAVASELNTLAPARGMTPARGPLGPERLLVVIGALLLVTLLALYGEYAYDIPAYPVWIGAAVAALGVGSITALVARASALPWPATTAALVILVLHLVNEAAIAVTPVLGRALSGVLPAGYWPPATLVHLVPTLVLPAAVAADVATRAIERRGSGRGRRAAGGAVVVAATFVASSTFWYELWQALPVVGEQTTLSWLHEMPWWGALVAVGAGALGALAGWNIGAMLRRSMPTVGVRVRPAAAVAMAILLLVAHVRPAAAHSEGPEHEHLPAMTIEFGADHVVAGVPLDVVVRVAPPEVMGAPYEAPVVSIDRAGVERRHALVPAAEPGAYRGTLVFPSARRWTIAVVLAGGDDPVFDWWRIDVGTPPAGAPIARTRALDVRTQDIRAPGEVSPGAILVGKLAVTAFTALLATAAFVALRGAAPDA
jgi:hypothetical protein